MVCHGEGAVESGGGGPGARWGFLGQCELSSLLLGVGGGVGLRLAGGPWGVFGSHPPWGACVKREEMGVLGGASRLSGLLPAWHRVMPAR